MVKQRVVSQARTPLDAKEKETVVARATIPPRAPQRNAMPTAYRGKLLAVEAVKGPDQSLTKAALDQHMDECPTLVVGLRWEFIVRRAPLANMGRNFGAFSSIILRIRCV